MRYGAGTQRIHTWPTTRAWTASGTRSTQYRGRAERVEPLPVVDQVRVLQGGLLLEMVGVPLQAEMLQRLVRLVEDRAAGRLVGAARLHADEAVLHELRLPDRVPPAPRVQPRDQ